MSRLISRIPLADKIQNPHIHRIDQVEQPQIPPECIRDGSHRKKMECPGNPIATIRIYSGVKMPVRLLSGQ